MTKVALKYTILACLQENVKVGIKKVIVKTFVQDPFNPICFSENTEKYIQLDSIICILTSYNYNQDVLELKEEELLLLQDETEQTSDVLTLTEATEIPVYEPEVMRHSSRRRQRRFAEDYLYYD